MNSKLKDTLHEMYRRSYVASTPKGNWDELLANAPINEEGQKQIPYMDYECDHDVLVQIFEDVCKEKKIKGDNKATLSMSFFLGCSPKSK